MADGDDDQDLVRDHYDVTNPWSGVSVLLSFVIEHLQADLRAATEAGDHCAASFSWASLDIVEAMAADLAEDPRAADEVLRYLWRAAMSYLPDTDGSTD